MKRLKSLSFFIIASLFLISCNSNQINTDETNNTSSKENNKVVSPDTTNPPNIQKECSLVFAGDVLVHSAQLEAAYNPSNKTYNFDESFLKVKDFISNADLAICNSETSYLGENSHYEGYPTFNSPTSVLDSLKNAGFDILSSAHNHSLDNNLSGFNSTAKAITDKGFDLIGIKNNESDKNYLIKEINGIKIGLTNYTYCEETSNGESLNGIPINKELKNRINIFSNTNDNLNTYIEKMKNTISDMKKDGAEFIIFYIHWGEEYNTSTSPNQEALAKALNKEGVNVIIGSHPHVVEPIRTLKDESSNNETLVCYSLGNFLSNQREETMGNSKSADGLMIKLDITKNNNSTSLKSYEAIPTWVNKYNDSNGKTHFQILNTKDVLNNQKRDGYSVEVFNKVQQSFNSTTSIINS